MQLQVSQSRTQFVCSREEQVDIRKEFDGRHRLLLRDFLEPRLLDDVRRRIDGAEANEVTHEVGHEIELKDERAKALLEFLVNDPVLCDAISALTGCGSIGCFSGRIYEMRSGSNHEFRWHTDLSNDRLIAMSINLGSEPYCGGVLQIAEASTKRLLDTVPNIGSGDAVIFRIAPTLMHRVIPVEGSTPKVAYAGWFCSRPSYHDVLGERSRTVAQLVHQSNA
ncbi:MAG: hypothetical protein HW392_1406 [Steroidobacteraceae bacterium]|nr:hypothetical protein [Steroidobacteraceae bacterium]